VTISDNNHSETRRSEAQSLHLLNLEQGEMRRRTKEGEEEEEEEEEEK